MGGDCGGGDSFEQERGIPLDLTGLIFVKVFIYLSKDYLGDVTK